MSHPLELNNPLVVSAFHAALLHQLLVILAVGLVLAVAWNVAFTLQQRRRPAAAESGQGDPGFGPPVDGAAATRLSEPAGRKFLRIAFGLLWLLDGLLQAQSAMPLGMPSGVIEPAAAGSPSWVHSLVNVGVTIWSDHPVQAAASAIWIQVGIGMLLLFAPRGRWSRAAGGVSAGWACVVWVFGEAFGGIFAPGASWAVGAPGAVVFYGLAGLLLMAPESAWRGTRLGRLVTGTIGLFFAGMALLQAWPGRGSWQGGTGSHAGNLVAMVRTMSTTPQPHFLSSWLLAFASFDGAHGWAVNLFLVGALSVVAVGLVAGSWARWPPAVLGATTVAVALCLADWVLVQDFGFLGGVGTDPNSMVPTLLLLGGGVIGLVQAPSVAPEPSFLSLREVRSSTRQRRWDVLTPTALFQASLVCIAVVITLVGAVPMAAASSNPNADPIVTEAVNGSPDLVNAAAPGFSLTDQGGKRISLASLRGKVIALTFLDPVCTSDCPLIAQSLRQADEMLGDQSKAAVFIAVVANPIYRSRAATLAFDREEGMTDLRNWLYLTGSLQALTRVWNRYGVQVSISPAGAMIDHSELAYVIDAHGRIRAVLASDPGTTEAAHASLSTLVADEMRSLLAT